MDRNARNVLEQRQRHVGRRMRATEAVEFFNVLTSPELLETTEALLPEYRERLYPPTVVLSMSCARCWKQMARARRRSTAGQRSARLMGSRLAAFVPAGTAERASACRWRWSVPLRTKPVVCSARRPWPNGFGAGARLSWWTARGSRCP